MLTHSLLPGIGMMILLAHTPAKAGEKMVRGKLSVTVSVTIFTCRTSHSASKIGRTPFLAPATAKNGRPHDIQRQATQGFMVGYKFCKRHLHFPHLVQCFLTKACGFFSTTNITNITLRKKIRTEQKKPPPYFGVVAV